MVTSPYTTCKASTLLALVMVLSACSTVETQSYVVSRESAVEAARISADADFSRYDRLHAEEMGIFFPEGAQASPEDIQRIRDTFRNAFLGELENYIIVTEPGPGAMTVQATLIDFREAAYQDTMNVRSELRDLASPGKIVFLMEMRDSVTDRVLARAADSAKTPVIADESGEMTDWPSVEDAASHWASLFRQFLDENLGR